MTEVIKSAKEMTLDNRRGTKLRIAALEVISFTKYKAARSQDSYDLQTIAQVKFDDIDWPYLRSLCESDYEFEDVRITLKHFRNG